MSTRGQVLGRGRRRGPARARVSTLQARSLGAPIPGFRFLQKFTLFDYVLQYKNSINAKKKCTLGRTF